MALKQMNSKYEAVCSGCGRRLEVGDEILWEKGRPVRCVGCGPHPSADGSPAGRPQKSYQPTPLMVERLNEEFATLGFDGQGIQAILEDKFRVSKVEVLSSGQTLGLLDYLWRLGKESDAGEVAF